MYKFNYSKMNRVIDNVKINLSNLTEIEDMINVFGGALLFFDDALSKAENLDNKLTIDYVNYFYREIFNITLNMNNLEIMKPVSDLLIEKLEKKVGKKKNNPYFNLMIDILILNALSFVQVSMIDGAKIYFDKAIDLGDKYLNDSSKNYHDSLCCACNWLGVIYYRENNSKGLSQLKSDMNKAGNVLNKAKKEIENELRRPIVTTDNFINLTSDDILIENK